MTSAAIPSMKRMSYDRKEEAIVDIVLSDEESTSEVCEHENQLIIDTNIDSQDISNVYCRDFGNRVGLNATVNGHKVKFLLDSGAKVNQISRQMAMDTKCEIESSEVLLRYGNASIQRAVGTVCLKYEFQGIGRVANMYVVDQVSDQALLGASFLGENNLLPHVAMRSAAVVDAQSLMSLLDNRFVLNFYNLSHRETGVDKRVSETVVTSLPELAVVFKDTERRQSTTPVDGQPEEPMPEAIAEVQLKRWPKQRSKGTRKGYQGRHSRKKLRNAEEVAITGGPKARALTIINSPANDVTIEVTDGLTIVDNEVDICNISNEEIATCLGQEVVDLDDRGKLLSLFNLSHLEEEQRSRLEDIIYKYRKVFSAHQYDVGHTDAFEFPINTVPD